MTKEAKTKHDIFGIFYVLVRQKKLFYSENVLQNLKNYLGIQQKKNNFKCVVITRVYKTDLRCSTIELRVETYL